MQIRVLGSVDVELNGSHVRLAGPKQRAVLSMLALNANATVSLERLVDGLWGEEPPSTAPKMVQQYVSQLRRLFAEDGAQILTRDGGYELRVDAAAVDVLRFERLVEQASHDGDGRRSELARQALELWHDPPLAGLREEPFAASEVRRLNELHLAAIELAIEGDLDAGRHAEVVGRLAALVDEHPLRERLRALLMLALYRAGRQAEALDAFREARWTLVETLGLEPGPELRRLQEAILRQDPALDLVIPDEAWANRETAQQADERAGRASQRRTELREIEHELAATVVDLHTLRERAAARRPRTARAACPFKGLQSFDERDAGYFFGRERLVAEIVARLPGTSLLGVIGPSGSGKSSAVRAGLLPALAAGVLPGSERWKRVVLRPGERPLERLRHALGADTPAAALAGVEPGSRLLVVVDQFEELFTACRVPAERTAFIDALVERDVRFLAVLALRADFYGACAAHPQLARLLGENHVLVGAMRPDELARAIEGPAAAAALTIDAELVSQLVEETAGQTGGLPLLSSTLLELWQRRSGDRVTIAAYERTGGVSGAVARLAETAYAQLGPAEAATARNILVRLAGEGEAEAAVRRQVPLAELDLGHSEPAQRVLAVLTESRLLTVGGDTVEVSHEALLREWPRLRGWLEHDAEARRLHRHITVATRDWEAGGRDPGELYRGARLAAALDLAAERGELLNEREREFLDEARLVSERDAERGRRMNRRLRGLLVAAFAALVIAGIAGLVALEQRKDARDAATVADAQRLGAQALTDDRLDRALLLARAGVELHDSVATRGNLLATLTRVKPGSLGVLPDVRDVPIYSVAVSPDGGRLAFGDAFGELQLFDLATRRKLASHRIENALVQRVAFAPDGALLAATWVANAGPTDDTMLELFDAGKLESLRRVVLPRLAKPVDFMGASPLFTADGNLAVLQVPFPSNQPEVVRLVDAGTGEIAPHVFRFRGDTTDPVITRDRRRVLVTSDHDDATYELDAADLRVVARHPGGGVVEALHPDGRTLALGNDDGAIRLLDLGTSQVRPFAGGHRGTVTALAFTPDGGTLASTGEDGKLLLWNAVTGRIDERFNAHTGEPLAITPDGETAITADPNGRVALWNLAGSRLLRPVALPRPFEVENDPSPRGVAISPDDRTLAVTESDGAVDLVDTAMLERRASLRVGEGPALAVDFSPDGRLLAVTGAHGHVSLWDARTLAPVGRLAGLSHWTQAAAFSPDGRLLAAGEASGDRPSLRIWDVRTGTATSFRIDKVVSAVAFSPDGRLLAAAAMENGVEIRDPRTARRVAALRTDELARSVAFSPDGRLLFVGLLNGAGQFYSTRDWRPVGGRIRGQDQRLLYARFTPDGKTLATSSADGTVLLWDVSTRKPIGSPLTVQRDSFVAAAISRDGAHLYALPTTTNGVRLALSPEAWKDEACAVAGRELTAREWADALPARDYVPVCPKTTLSGPGIPGRP
jgi:WD40 repeat protein/DNA-binding SARP family transcriptional activator